MACVLVCPLASSSTWAQQAVLLMSVLLELTRETSQQRFTKTKWLEIKVLPRKRGLGECAHLDHQAPVPSNYWEFIGCSTSCTAECPHSTHSRFASLAFGSAPESPKPISEPIPWRAKLLPGSICGMEKWELYRIVLRKETNCWLLELTGTTSNRRPWRRKCPMTAGSHDGKNGHHALQKTSSSSSLKRTLWTLWTCAGSRNQPCDAPSNTSLHLDQSASLAQTMICKCHQMPPNRIAWSELIVSLIRLYFCASLLLRQWIDPRLPGSNGCKSSKMQRKVHEITNSKSKTQVSRWKSNKTKMYSYSILCNALPHRYFALAHTGTRIW